MWVYLGVKTCEVFLCLVAIVKVRFIMLTSLSSFFYVTGECHRFLHSLRAGSHLGAHARAAKSEFKT